MHRRCDAVAARLIPEIDDRFASTVDGTVCGQREGVNFHGPGFRFLAGANAVGAVIMVGEVQRLSIRADRETVGLANVMRHFPDRPVTVDLVDGAMLKFAWLGPDVFGIGEVNPPLTVNADVVGSIKRSP